MKKVCIVGYGSIAPLHEEAIKKTQNAELYSVCDIRESQFDLCRQKNENVICYNNFDEMLSDDTIDSIHICTPHYLHYPMIEKAIKANKMVVCEKPITMTRKEFDLLLKNKNCQNVCVVLQSRLNNSVIKLKSIIENCSLGKIISLKGIVTWQRDKAYYAQAQWRGKYETEGGGVLINQAIHTLDLLCYFAGEVTSVKAHVNNFSLPEIEVEDTVVASLHFDNGVVGNFFATNSYGVSVPPEIQIVFENGVAEYRNSKLFINDRIVAEDEKSKFGKPDWGAGHAKLIENFYDKEIYINPLNIKNTMNAMFDIYDCSAKII